MRLSASSNIETLAVVIKSDEDEDDLLDKAWGLDRDSRLSCQVVTGNHDLVVEIPRYTVNMVSERH